MLGAAVVVDSSVLPGEGGALSRSHTLKRNVLILLMFDSFLHKLFLSQRVDPG